MTLPSTDQALRWIGLPVADPSGANIGSCRNVFADDDSGVPEWVEVELSSGDVAFVPTLGASDASGTLTVAHALDVVDRAPRFEGDVDLSPEAEKALYDHYGVPYSSERSSTLLPAAADGAPTSSETGGETSTESSSATEAPAPTARLRRMEPQTTAAPEPAAAPAPVRPVPPAPAPLPQPASSGTSKTPLLAGAGAAAVAAAALAERRRRRNRRPEVTPEQGGAAGLAALLLAVGGLLALRRRRKDEHVEVGPVVPLPTVVDHTGLVGRPVDPAAVDPAVADPQRAPY